MFMAPVSLRVRSAWEQSSSPATKRRMASVRELCHKYIPGCMPVQFKLTSLDHLSSPLCTDPESNPPLFLEDLISFSFQVARGMEYLASRKVRCLSPLCVNPHVCSCILYLCRTSVYPQRPGSQECSAVWQQSGEDLWLRPGQRHLQRPRLRPQGRRECLC